MHHVTRRTPLPLSEYAIADTGTTGHYLKPASPTLLANSTPTPSPSACPMAPVSPLVTPVNSTSQRYLLKPEQATSFLDSPPIPCSPWHSFATTDAKCNSPSSTVVSPKMARSCLKVPATLSRTYGSCPSAHAPPVSNNQPQAQSIASTMPTMPPPKPSSSNISMPQPTVPLPPLGPKPLPTINS